MNSEVDSESFRYENLKEFTTDFSKLLSFDSFRERLKFADTAEEILSKLEKFIDIADAIRSQNNMASYAALTQLKEKSNELEHYFQIIDKLEVFTNLVKEQVVRADIAVNKAETELNTSQMKKAISFLSINPSKGRSRPSFEPFPIMETDTYFPLIDLNNLKDD